MKTINADEVVAPVGMSGLACEPWARGEIYAVAANWSQASGQVVVYSPQGWQPLGHQVADFRHSGRAALASVIRGAIQASGDEMDDETVADIVEAAVEIRSHELGAMCDVLKRHGDAYAGDCVADSAQGWIDEEFDADSADDWCEIGVWDAGVASRLRDADLLPQQVAAAAERLVEDMDDEQRREAYTDGDPIYSACNYDTDVEVIISAAQSA